MVGWHHQLHGHEFEYTLGAGDGQGGLACCGPWGRKESDTTEQLKWEMGRDEMHVSLYVPGVWRGSLAPLGASGTGPELSPCRKKKKSPSVLASCLLAGVHTML